MLSRTSFLVALLSPAALVCAAEPDFSRFPRYTAYHPPVPVYEVASEHTLHRFFDTSPISPSGRYLAVLRLPFEDRSPSPGDCAQVVQIDLQSGVERILTDTHGWEMQVGANLQWGRSDKELYFNDVDLKTWSVFAVQLNPATGARRTLGGTVFMVSPDGSQLASHDLIRSRRAQAGYGVVIPDDKTPKNVGPVSCDGVYLTDTKTGQSRMLVSIRDIYEKSVPSVKIPNPGEHEFYCFQTKWNRQGTRLLTSLQWTPLTGGKRRRAVITMKPDGTEICTAITAEQWDRGGHHINWCPDGDHVSMNLNIGTGKVLDIITAKFDGSELKSVARPGSGHPSFDPTGRYIILDSYPYEPVAPGDGTVPIRLIDTKTHATTVIARVFVSMARGEFRLDPHPAWDRSGKFVVFNGLTNTGRKVYLADLRQLLQ